ncbi:MAG: ABC transporter permease [Dehalococcoidia bacterium]
MALSDVAAVSEIGRGRGQATHGLSGAVRAFRRKPLAAFAAILIAFVLVFVLVGPIIVPFSALDSDSGAVLRPPSATHWLGTDQYGRDIFARLSGGGRISLLVGVGAVLISSLLGTTLGLLSGYLGGAIDFGLQRLIDIEMSMPTLLLLLVIGVVLGHSIAMLVLAIGVLAGFVPPAHGAGAVLGVATMPYVEAATTLGATHLRVVLRHVLPNIVAPVLVIATIGLGQAIILESTLSFLGYGVPPPNPSWGGMLGGSSRRFIYQAPWLPIMPGVALGLTVYAFNMLGDGLRDLLDPRLKTR